MSRERKRLLVAVLVPVQVTTAALALRDMARRGDDEVRGRKRFWRVAVCLNPGNAGFYWLLGRR